MRRAAQNEPSLVELQLTLYNSRNPTRRWLHTSRRDWISAAISRLAGQRATGRALEVGPGSGTYLPELCQLFDEVVASDVEPGFLSHAQPLRQQHPNLDLVLDDITDSKLEPGSFDLVLCSEVIEHLDDPAKALRSMHRLLRAGGVLVLSTPQRHSPLEVAGKLAFKPGVLQLVRLAYREPILPPGHISLLTRRQLQAQLSQVGFRIVETHLSGLYLPLVAELGGRPGLRLERRLEERLRRGRLSGLLWTQFHVAEA